MKKYVCTVCGYVYEGDELPEDYECPLCGVGPELFEEEGVIYCNPGRICPNNL